MRQRDDLAFPMAEYDRRLDELRERIGRDGYNAVLIATPENICYLTGFESPGYFAFEGLLVPLEGELAALGRVDVATAPVLGQEHREVALARLEVVGVLRTQNLVGLDPRVEGVDELDEGVHAADPLVHLGRIEVVDGQVDGFASVGLVHRALS